MAKVKQFEKVLEAIKAVSPEAITKEDLADVLKDTGVEFYRLPTYIWEIKNKAGVPLESIKDGRKVVAYRFSLPVTDAVDVGNKVSMTEDASDSALDTVGDDTSAVAAVS